MSPSLSQRDSYREGDTGYDQVMLNRSTKVEIAGGVVCALRYIERTQRQGAFEAIERAVRWS